MSRFVRLESHDPYVTFATTLHRLRPAIKRSYYAAFAASDASNEALNLYQWETSSEPLVPELLGASFPTIQKTGIDPEILYAEAIAEDAHCDMQATIVVLFADDLLQRFGQRVLEKRIGLDGFGSIYRGVHLTTLLHATTNCVRHVSEWEDYPFPYRAFDDAETNDERRAIRSIEVLQKAYGLGKHERIRDFVSWHTVVTIDGLYGTHPPDYQRFEDALVEGARDLARHAGGSALADLDAQSFLRVQKRKDE
jgi:hypothetical protein